MTKYENPFQDDTLGSKPLPPLSFDIFSESESRAVNGPTTSDIVHGPDLWAKKAHRADGVVDPSGHLSIVGALRKVFEYIPPAKLENTTWKDVLLLPSGGLLVGEQVLSDPLVHVAIYRLAPLGVHPGPLVPRVTGSGSMSASLMRACVRADVTDAHFNVVRWLDVAWDSAVKAPPQVRTAAMRRVIYGQCTPNSVRRAIVKYGGESDAPVLAERGAWARNRPSGVTLVEDAYALRLQSKYPKSWRCVRSRLRRLLRAPAEERDRLLHSNPTNRTDWRNYMQWREATGLGSISTAAAAKRVGEGSERERAPVKGRHRVALQDDGTLMPLLSVREVAAGAIGYVTVEPTETARALVGQPTSRDASGDLFPEHAGYFEAWMRVVHGSTGAAARVEAQRLLHSIRSLRPYLREDGSIAPIALAVRMRLLPPSYRWAWNLYVRALAEADLPGPRSTILPWAPRSERLMPKRYEDACVKALRWAAARGFRLKRFLSATGEHVLLLSGSVHLFTLMRNDLLKPTGKNAIRGYPLDAEHVQVFSTLLQWRNAAGFHAEYDARHDGVPALDKTAPLFVLYPQLGMEIPGTWWEKLIARHLTPAEAAILAGEKLADAEPTPEPEPKAPRAPKPAAPAAPSKRTIARKRHVENEAKKRAEWEAEVAETLQERVDYLKLLRGDSLTNPFQDTDGDDGGSRG